MPDNRDRFPLGEPGEMVDVKCAYCYGAGKDPFGIPGPESNCCVCGGKGYNRVAAPYVPCVVCGGTGKARSRRLTCSTCKGRGVMTVRGPTTPCPRCHGTGRQPDSEHDLACTLCGGRGRMEQGKHPASRTAALKVSPSLRPAVRPVTTRPTRAPPLPPPPITRPVSRPSIPPPTVSKADQIAAHINNFGGARPGDIQVIFDLSPDETERTLQALMQGRRVRQKEDGLYYPA